MAFLFFFGNFSVVFVVTFLVECMRSQCQTMLVHRHHRLSGESTEIHISVQRWRTECICIYNSHQLRSCDFVSIKLTTAISSVWRAESISDSEAKLKLIRRRQRAREKRRWDFDSRFQLKLIISPAYNSARAISRESQILIQLNSYHTQGTFTFTITRNRSSQFGETCTTSHWHGSKTFYGILTRSSKNGTMTRTAVCACM